MNAVTLVVRRLLADAGVAALVDTEVFPVLAPQGFAAPHIVVSLVHEDADVVLEGHRNGFFSRVSVQCKAADVSAAIDIGEAVKSALAIVNEPVYSGATPPVEIGTITCWKEGTDITDYGDDRSVFRRLLDYRVRWTE